MIRMIRTGSILISLCLFIAGCSSKLIEYSGLRVAFIWGDAKAPIADTEVINTRIAREYTARAKAGESGVVQYEPTFTEGYAGFPTNAVSLQLSWELKLGDKHNPSGSGLFLNNTDVDDAIIDAGTIKLVPVFRAEHGGGLDADSRGRRPG